jgi:hypothetical protein
LKENSSCSVVSPVEWISLSESAKVDSEGTDGAVKESQFGRRCVLYDGDNDDSPMVKADWYPAWEKLAWSEHCSHNRIGPSCQPPL